MEVLFNFGHRRSRVRFVAAALLLAAMLLTVFAGPALADTWSDITDVEWQTVYRITAAQAWRVAEGYPDGTFGPAQPVTRGQFAKMAVEGSGIPKVNPPVRRFNDVPRGHIFYEHVEGAAAAGIINGYPDGTYGPDNNIKRQQCNSILGAYLANFEKQCYGYILGNMGQYNSLEQWFAFEGPFWLGGFQDDEKVDTVHQPGTAYLIYRGIVLGSESGGKYYLSPHSNLARAQAVAMIVRVEAKAAEFSRPAVTSVSPNSGPFMGGNEVEIRGHGFVGVTQVAFGPLVAGYTVESGTKITATAPAGIALGTVPVRVTTTKGGMSNDTAADDYTYIAAPVISLLSPNAGPPAGGNSVIIGGSGFVDVEWVKFGDIILDPAMYTVDGFSQISATVPAVTTLGTVRVSVSARGGVTSETAGAQYVYVAAPTVAGLDPDVGPTTGGNEVIVSGTNFIAPVMVKFGDSAATVISVDSSVQVRATAPPHVPGKVDVAVSAAGGVSADTAVDDYTYYSTPAVSSVEPGHGPVEGGTDVIITGTDFIAPVTVMFGDVTATSVQIDSTTQVTARTPVHEAGAVDVAVITPGGTGTKTAGFEYHGIPVLSALSPNAGPAGGGDIVTLSGIAFCDVLYISFGDKTVAPLGGYSPTSLRVKTPVPVSYPADVTVAVTSLTGTSNGLSYHYSTRPTVISVDPTVSPLGEADVVVKGTEFYGVQEVWFGGMPVSRFQVLSPTQISVTVPTHEAGTVDVVVNAAGGLGTGYSLFEYVGAPTIVSVDPTTGTLGTSVEIEGSNFVGSSAVPVSVMFSGIPAESVTVDGRDKLTVIVPDLGSADTDATVTVTAAGGSALWSLFFRYFLPST